MNAAALLATALLVAVHPAAVRNGGFADLQRDYVAFTYVQDPLRAGAQGDRAALARWPDDSYIDEFHPQ